MRRVLQIGRGTKRAADNDKRRAGNSAYALVGAANDRVEFPTSNVDGFADNAADGVAESECPVPLGTGGNFAQRIEATRRCFVMHHVDGAKRRRVEFCIQCVNRDVFAPCETPLLDIGAVVARHCGRAFAVRAIGDDKYSTQRARGCNDGLNRDRS